VYAIQSTSKWSPVALAVALLGLSTSNGAFAGEDDFPLSLTLSQAVSRDSNFTKNDAARVPETIATTAAQVSLNKQYGRQTYQGSLKLSDQKYHNFGYLDNSGVDGNFAFSTEMLRDWLISANGMYSKALNLVQNNSINDRTAKNIRTYRDGGFSVQYGNGGRWAVAGSYDSNRLNYSDNSLNNQDARQHSTGLKVIYYASDVLSYSLGERSVVTSYPNNLSYSQATDHNIDLSSDWQVSGLSNLNVTVTRRSTNYIPDNIAGSKGWTGSLYWVYTPHGILTYNVGFSRTTGADRQSYSGSQFAYYSITNGQVAAVYDNAVSKINNNTITTSLNLGARAQLTGKFAATAGYSVTKFSADQVNSLVFQDASSSNSFGSQTVGSYNHVASVGLSYDVLRSVSLGCNYQRYSQGADILYHLKYSGREFDCTASFTLNPLN